MSMERWMQLGVKENMAARLMEKGIKEPTAIQEQAIPLLLEGKNISGGSQTGTGKTLAYLLPLLQKIDADSKAVQVVILSPTQELAMQIVRVADEYADVFGVRVQQLIGGAAVKRQIEKLKLNPQLVVGTPGRIHELLKVRKLKLNAVHTIIVDEADQVFGLGSTSEVETILWAAPKDRQISFFSATNPPILTTLEKRWMKDSQRIDIMPEQRVSSTIQHAFIGCEWRDRLDIARKLIRLLNPSSALLFINDTDQIANYEAKLSFEGFNVETLYGDANKQDRAATLARFRDGRCQLLIATDVAARGLDIPGLPLVINLEPPADADQYVHRAGRTGRMGREGQVFTIAAPGERYLIEKYKKKLGVELPELTMYKGKLMDPASAPRRGTPAKRSSDAQTSRSGPSRTPLLDKLSTSKATVQATDQPAAGKAAAYGTGQPSAGRAAARDASVSSPGRAAAGSAAVSGHADSSGAAMSTPRNAAPSREAAAAPGSISASGAAPSGSGNAALSKKAPAPSQAPASSRTTSPGQTPPSSRTAAPGERTASAGAAKSKPIVSPAAKAKKAKADKNKGAPKWLKAKRDHSDT